MIKFGACFKGPNCFNGPGSFSGSGQYKRLKSFNGIGHLIWLQSFNSCKSFNSSKSFNRQVFYLSIFLVLLGFCNSLPLGSGKPITQPTNPTSVSNDFEQTHKDHDNVAKVQHIPFDAKEINEKDDQAYETKSDNHGRISETIHDKVRHINAIIDNRDGEKNGIDDIEAQHRRKNEDKDGHTHDTYNQGQTIYKTNRIKESDERLSQEKSKEINDDTENSQTNGINKERDGQKTRKNVHNRIELSEKLSNTHNNDMTDPHGDEAVEEIPLEQCEDNDTLSNGRNEDDEFSSDQTDYRDGNRLKVAQQSKDRIKEINETKDKDGDVQSLEVSMSNGLAKQEREANTNTTQTYGENDPETAEFFNSKDDKKNTFSKQMYTIENNEKTAMKSSEKEDVSVKTEEIHQNSYEDKSNSLKTNGSMNEKINSINTNEIHSPANEKDSKEASRENSNETPNKNTVVDKPSEKSIQTNTPAEELKNKDANVSTLEDESSQTKHKLSEDNLNDKQTHVQVVKDNKSIRRKSILDSLKNSFHKYKSEDIVLSPSDIQIENIPHHRALTTSTNMINGKDKTDTKTFRKDRKDTKTSEPLIQNTEDSKGVVGIEANGMNSGRGKEMSKEERRAKMKKSLSNVENAHKQLKKQLKNDIYNPPGINNDLAKRKVVKRKLKTLKSEKSAFELSVNHRYNEVSRNLNSKASTSFKTLDPKLLMTGGTGGDLRCDARGKNDRARNLVANLKIQPVTGIGHSDSDLSSSVSSSPFVWREVPDHFTYLGLIDTPEKYRTNDYDRKLIQDYAKVMEEVKTDMYGSGGDNGSVSRYGGGMKTIRRW